MLWKGSQVPQEEDEEAVTKKAIKELEIFFSQIFYNFFLFISFFQLLYFITFFRCFFYPRHLPTPTPTTHTHDPRPLPTTHDPRHLATLQKFQFEILWIGTVHSGCTDPTQATAWNCSCMQVTKEQYWGQQFCQMERDISVRPTKMTRPVKVDHLQSSVLNIPVRPNWNGPFHWMNQPKFLEFWVEWKAPKDSLSQGY